MEFRFTYNDTFEQTFRLDSDTILKIKSFDINETCVVVPLYNLVFNDQVVYEITHEKLSQDVYVLY